MEMRSVEAGQGWQWIVDGFALFRKNPLIWIVLCIIMLLITLMLMPVPILGPLIFILLLPTLMAGLMTGCRALDQGEELEIAHLFAGFQKNPTPLITIGGVYLVGQVLISSVAILIIGASVLQDMLDMLNNSKEFNPEVLMSMMSTIMLGMLVAMALSIPLMMAIWFAPLLVIFDDVPALAAMRLSFFACLKNFVPFLVNGIALFILTIIAAIPFWLGFLVLIPTLFASIYVSYKDIFARPTETTVA